MTSPVNCITSSCCSTLIPGWNVEWWTSSSSVWPVLRIAASLSMKSRTSPVRTSLMTSLLAR